MANLEKTLASQALARGGAPDPNPLKRLRKIAVARIAATCDKRITQERTMTTEIKYQLFRVTGPDEGYQVGQLFNSEMVAKNHALNIKDDNAQEYKIRSIVTTTSTLDVFTVPAHVPTLEEIAQDIIAGSDGSFYMEWGDHFERLEEPARSEVEDMVNEAITSCDGCGWHFHVESMEHFDDTGDTLCYKCAEDRYNEEEDEEEDESDED